MIGGVTQKNIIRDFNTSNDHRTNQSLSEDEYPKIAEQLDNPVKQHFEETKEVRLRNSQGQFDLGVICLSKGEISKALCYFHESAKQGNCDAHQKLGEMYANGQHVQKNDQMAFVHYKKSIELGNPNAHNLHGVLGEMYRQGQGVPKNLELAAYHYREADRYRDGMPSKL
jgi:TPR repeat protein